MEEKCTSQALDEPRINFFVRIKNKVKKIDVASNPSQQEEHNHPSPMPQESPPSPPRIEESEIVDIDSPIPSILPPREPTLKR